MSRFIKLFKIFTVLGFAASSLGSVASAITLPEAVDACSSGVSSFPAGSVVELLIAAGADVDGTAQARYKAIATSALIQACRAGGVTVQIRAIDAQSRENENVFSATAPSTPHESLFNNPFILQDERAAFLASGLNALDGLYRRPARPGADILGGLEAAANAMLNSDAHTTIVVISSAWQQRDPNVYTAGEDPATFTQRFIAAQQKLGGLPNLRGAFVLFVGINAGPSAMGEYRYLPALCTKFWKPIIKASHGIWRGCWPEFPSDIGVSL